MSTIEFPTFPVHEIFSSIQGEASNAGYPCTFIRLYGCNLRCTYCDTGYYSHESAKNIPHTRMSISAIIEEVKKHKNNLICITGGEPLIHPNIYMLVKKLLELDVLIEIETNGSVPILDEYERSEMFPDAPEMVRYIMDIKTPCSGEVDQNLMENLDRLTYGDDVVMVISDSRDYEFAKQVILDYFAGNNHSLGVEFFLSPVNVAGKVDPTDSQMAHQFLPQWLMEDNLPNTRIQLQMHKFLGMR